mmetsp:Transcript_1610/g.2134  ORF Transcript_1610/g.2134 Transcript_1610/m.2134 type:complete len:690 (+) Transcript_1610:62-2131(+)
MQIKSALAFLILPAAQLRPGTEASPIEEYHPDHISYSNLSKDASIFYSSAPEPLLTALTSEGLISVTGVPGFASLKRSMMQWLHACIMDQGQDAEHVLETIQKDGTIRRAIASVTVPGPGGDQDFNFLQSEDLSNSCQNFSKNLKTFRNQVAEVTALFAQRLNDEMASMYDMPLMFTEDGSHNFDDIKNVIFSGDHLEHFVTYQKLPESSSSKEQQSATIDFHTDQGFFIAFAPGLMVSHSNLNPNLDEPVQEAIDFLIEKRDGTHAHVHFDYEDDLIFMMGDGVNQYINPKLKKDGISNVRLLRATPHSIELSTHDDNLARVWYGRMILPPQLAYSERDGRSYGEVRSLLSAGIEDRDDIPAGLGCSSTEHRALSAGHGGGGTPACDDGYLFCWARCMSLTDYGIDSEETCTDQALQLQCVNPRDQKSSGHAHGDYYPACSNTVANVTAATPLDSYPRDEDVCTDALWETFSAISGYDFSFDLSNKAKIFWSVEDDKVRGHLAFNGLFGFLSFGLTNLAEDAAHYGMNGANVLLATPATEYSALEGFDFSTESLVDEYRITDGYWGSAFRLWQEPWTNSTSDVSTDIFIDDLECFTSFSFEADGINSQKFNISGSDELLWAANEVDAFAGYHGRENRARFKIDWTTGEASFWRSTDTVEEEDPPDSAASKMLPVSLVVGIATVAAFII